MFGRVIRSKALIYSFLMKILVKFNARSFKFYGKQSSYFSYLNMNLLFEFILSFTL